MDHMAPQSPCMLLIYMEILRIQAVSWNPLETHTLAKNCSEEGSKMNPIKQAWAEEATPSSLGF